MITEDEALRRVRIAARWVAISRPRWRTTTIRYRKANGLLAKAQMAAVDSGARPADIVEASNWERETV